jgi:hypothetical protein
MVPAVYQTTPLNEPLDKTILVDDAIVAPTIGITKPIATIQESPGEKYELVAKQKGMIAGNLAILVYGNIEHWDVSHV